MHHPAPYSVILATLLLAFGCGGPAAEEPAAPATSGDTSDAPQGPPDWIRRATEMPRGLIRNEAGAAPGYVLFTQLTSDAVFLADREGRIVHTWQSDKAGDAVYLLDDGTLLRQARIPDPPGFKAGGTAGYVQKLAWDGEVLWEWRMGDEKRMLHHDVEPLPNGNVLAVAWELKTPEEARAAGRRPDLVPEQGLWSEWVLEIEPVPPDGARIVWEWHVWDHLVQNVDPDAPNYGSPAERPHRLDINADAGAPMVDAEELERLKALGYVPDDATQEDLQSDFLHMNAVDYHAGLDQIALSVPEIGELWIIDHSTTTAQARGSSGGRSGRGGDLLYRWGNPRTYGRGEKSDQQLFYQHEVRWIPEGYENAGNLTVFNNGGGRPDGSEWSAVLEIAPPLNADGTYALAEGAAFGPEAPAWSYSAPDRGSFFCPFISGAHRLSNGNTFVCSGAQGRYFEVTRGGEIVWEYRNPLHGSAKVWMPDGVEQFPYASFRATKLPPDHPGLAGRTLVPLDPQPEPYLPPAP